MTSPNVQLLGRLVDFASDPTDQAIDALIEALYVHPQIGQQLPFMPHILRAGLAGQAEQVKTFIEQAAANMAEGIAGALKNGLRQ